MTTLASSVPSWWFVKPAESRSVAPSLLQESHLKARNSMQWRRLYGRASPCLCRSRKKADTQRGQLVLEDDDDGPTRRVLQVALWALEGVYIGWLFLSPYAPVGYLFELIAN